MKKVTDHAPAWFRAELQRRFGSGYDVEWDDTVCRWVVISPSTTGRPVRQLVVQRFHPQTGEPLRAGPGELLPFKELTPDTMAEILHAMEQHALTNRATGAGTWAEHTRRVVDHNENVSRKAIREAAELYAYGLQQVDLRRPWIKHHSRNPTERRIASGGR